MEQRERLRVLSEMYERLSKLRASDGVRRLEDASVKDGLPSHGVYFFFEPGEIREDGSEPRVVRVGTHALRETSKATLWSRLRAHRGTLSGRRPGGGNHRGSIFRLHIGTALINRVGYPKAAETWGEGSSAKGDVRDREVELERAVSKHIRSMPFLVATVDDRLARATLEQTSIALLSNYGRAPVDPPSEGWLGHDADRSAIRESGLWNVNHVAEDPTDLGSLALIS